MPPVVELHKIEVCRELGWELWWLSPGLELRPGAGVVEMLALPSVVELHVVELRWLSSVVEQPKMPAVLDIRRRLAVLHRAEQRVSSCRCCASSPAAFRLRPAEPSDLTVFVGLGVSSSPS